LVSESVERVEQRVNRFPCFDGLRALAALAVFAFHSTGVLYGEDPRFLPFGLARWFGRLGFFGVAVFFVISGFLLYRPYAVAALTDHPAPSLGPFWRRRFVRIFPAYWIALTFIVVVLSQYEFTSIGNAVTYFGLFENYRGGYERFGLGVAWTLGIEVSFYVVLPGLAWLLRKAGGIRGQLVGLAAMAAVAWVLRYWWLFVEHLGPASSTAWFTSRSFYVWLPAFFDWFALGMLMAVGSTWLQLGRRIPRWVEALGRWPWLSWGLAFACYAVVVRMNPAPFPLFPPGQRFWRWALMGLAGAFFVLPAVFGAQERGTIRWLLRTRPLVLLGIVSYGIYLYHLPFWIAAPTWSWFPSPMVAQVAVVLALTVLAATASYRLVERPLNRWARRRL
jgi:peptidoglycan/LPS O-acetylase OafA/YrhL